MNENQKLIFNYLKSWAKDHKDACPLVIMRNALTCQMSTDSFRRAILRLMISGHIRENMRGNYKSYTLLRSSL